MYKHQEGVGKKEGKPKKGSPGTDNNLNQLVTASSVTGLLEHYGSFLSVTKLGVGGLVLPHRCWHQVIAL